MDTALSILLSLHAIISPGTYYTSQIDSFEIVYSIPISNIENNLGLLLPVLAEYEPEIEGITILDNGQLK